MTSHSIVSVENVPGFQTLCFWLPGTCVPKARARVTCNGTYFPQRYQDWRKLAETEIIISLSPSEKILLPIQRAEVRIKLQGKHRGDIDNIAGSCLDALVAAGILVDDRLSCLPRLVIEHEPKGEAKRVRPKGPDRGVSIEVMALALLPNTSTLAYCDRAIVS